MNHSYIEDCLIKRMHVHTHLEPVRTWVTYGPFFLKRYHDVTYIGNEIINNRLSRSTFFIRDILSEKLYDAL